MFFKNKLNVCRKNVENSPNLAFLYNFYNISLIVSNSEKYLKNKEVFARSFALICINLYGPDCPEELDFAYSFAFKRMSEQGQLN